MEQNLICIYEFSEKLLNHDRKHAL